VQAVSQCWPLPAVAVQPGEDSGVGVGVGVAVGVGVGVGVGVSVATGQSSSAPQQHTRTLDPYARAAPQTGVLLEL